MLCDISTGNPVLVIKKTCTDLEWADFLNYLVNEGFEHTLCKDNNRNYLFINLYNMKYAYAVYGAKLTTTIVEDFISIEDFKIIWNILKKYRK